MLRITIALPRDPALSRLTRLQQDATCASVLDRDSLHGVEVQPENSMP